jgi:integrase
MLALLIRTGLRRSEIASLRWGDFDEAQGHRIATVRAKGGVLRTIKIPPDVWRVIEGWRETITAAKCERAEGSPVFVRLDGQNGARALTDRAIYEVVRKRLRMAGIEGMGPHSLRATFVTLALEGGAPLHLVQRAAGHADPRTTERYWRRKHALDDNAVDYIRL